MAEVIGDEERTDTVHYMVGMCKRLNPDNKITK
jgi:hypothetical protein